MQDRSNTARMIEELRRRRRGKVVSAAEAVQLVRSGDTVATGGFVGIGFAEGIAVALVDPGWVRTDMGGPDAPLSVEESVSAMRRTLAGLTLADRGAFLRHDGSRFEGW